MEITEWQNVVGLPIVSRPSAFFTLENLEFILDGCITACAKECQRKNSGKIMMTLSGGLDSSLCLAFIRKNLGDSALVFTYTIGSNKNHPDILHARLISEKYKTYHREFIPTQKQIERAKKKKRTNPELFPGEADLKTGGIGAYLLYRFISRDNKSRSRWVIAHDGIDELMGGYWAHRDPKNDKSQVFRGLWEKLPADHLEPLQKKADSFNLFLVFPYLQPILVSFISGIPLRKRTNAKESKILLRAMARKYLPEEIIKRKKIGFHQVLSDNL